MTVVIAAVRLSSRSPCPAMRVVGVPAAAIGLCRSTRDAGGSFGSSEGHGPRSSIGGQNGRAWAEEGKARCGTGGAGGLSHQRIQQIEAKALRKLRVGLPEGLLSDLIAELREGC